MKLIQLKEAAYFKSPTYYSVTITGFPGKRLDYMENYLIAAKNEEEAADIIQKDFGIGFDNVSVELVDDEFLNSYEYDSVQELIGKDKQLPQRHGQYIYVFSGT